MKNILTSGEWKSPPIVVATRFWDRWQGLRPRAEGQALLLRAASVHGFGMRESLWIVALDESAAVVSVRLLLPGRRIRIRGASWLLELSASMQPPAVGLHLEAWRASG